MYFQKIRHPSNFRFATAHDGGALQLGGAAPLQAQVRDLGEDVFHVELRDAARKRRRRRHRVDAVNLRDGGDRPLRGAGPDLRRGSAEPRLAAERAPRTS